MSCYDPVTACGNDMKIIQADEPQGNDYEVNDVHKYMYWASQKNLVKGCRQTLDCYCIRCELLSASIADALLFVNILVSGIFHGRFAQRLAVNKQMPDKHWWKRRREERPKILISCLFLGNKCIWWLIIP